MGRFFFGLPRGGSMLHAEDCCVHGAQQDYDGSYWFQNHRLLFCVEVGEMNWTYRVIKWIAALLLAICRTIYCWIYFIFALAMIGVVYNSVANLMHTHEDAKGHIFTVVVFASYSIILAVAWWMIFRDKPRLQRWAIAASGVLAFTFLPVLFISWRRFLEVELEMWPFVLFGIFGMILFGIPYRPKISGAPSGCDEGVHPASDMEAARVNFARWDVKRFAVMLLAICRTVYCWAFLIISIATFCYACVSIAQSIHAHEDINRYFSSVFFFISFSIIWGITWWMIFRDKPTANRWAITASVMVFFIYLLAIFAGGRIFLRMMHYIWPEVLFGVLGVIIFSIPYRPRISGAPHSCSEDIHPVSTPGSTAANF